VVEVKDKRRYTSTVREEQAARTRMRILDAASELFLERGYALTTMKDIAARADVARDTVHAIFGNKAQVLTALIDLRLVPDGTVTNVTQRPDAQAIKNEVDQRKQVELFAKFIAGISTELRPIAEILRTASAVEPEMAKVFEEMNRFRMNNMQTYAKWIAARGPLRVSTRRAGEIIWALASPDVARMLCNDIGWTESQNARWLADTLIRTLLPGEDQQDRRGPSSGPAHRS
jgi:AcrR family transcriptional regulator